MGSGRSDTQASDTQGPAERAGHRAAALSRLCVVRPLPDPVLADVDAALVSLLSDVMAHVRAEIAVRLAGCDWAPVEAVRMLAFDDFKIAQPLLERSRRLAEDDLEALAERDSERRCAIARRSSLSERITVLIAAKRERECLVLLARNPGARLSEASAGDFASVARGAPDLQHGLAARSDLKPGLARALMAVAGEAVKAELAARWPDLASDRVEAAIGDAVTARPDDAEAGALVNQLARQGLLSAADLVRAAEGGREAMTDQIAARLTGLEIADWRRALARSPLRANLLCARAAALSVEDAARLHAALAATGRAHALDPDRLGAACLDVYSDYHRDAARRALHRLGADASIH